MNINLHILKASEKINQYSEEINNIFTDAVKKITEVLPVKNVDNVVVDNPYQTIPEIGIGGHTYSPNFIVVSLNPDFENFQNVLRKELEDTFAHELHHAARWQAVGYGHTLLEAMVSEGLADHFAIEITKRADTHPWNKALNYEQLNTISQLAGKEYNNKDYDHKKWFFGSKEENLPKWTAYTLGFQLIDKYLNKYPGKKHHSYTTYERKSLLNNSQPTP